MGQIYEALKKRMSQLSREEFFREFEGITGVCGDDEVLIDDYITNYQLEVKQKEILSFKLKTLEGSQSFESFFISFLL